MILPVYVDLPVYRMAGWAPTVSTLPPSIPPIKGFKRLMFILDLPDDVMKDADIVVPAEKVTCMGEVA